MRILSVILCLFVLNSVFAQSPLTKTKWALRERQIYADRDAGKIDDDEWYKRKRIRAGSLGMSFQAWFVSKGIVAELFLRKHERLSAQDLQMIIPDNYQVVKENGNSYIKLLLVNNSDTAIPISRNDATVIGISCYVKVGNEWIVLRGSPIVPCGNSFFSDTLQKKSLMTIEMDNPDHGDGTTSIPFKLKYQFNGQLIESNEIKIKLHINQIHRLIEESEILKRNQKTPVALHTTSALRYGG